MANRHSEAAVTYPLPTADIGATNTAAVDTTHWAAWRDMKNFDRIYAKVVLGTWNAGDDLDECRLQQADSATGGNAKDLTTDASGGNYDTDNPVDATGNFVVLEARAADLDVDNGFRYVRVYCAEGGDSGTDEVFGVLMLCHDSYQRPQLDGVASTGAQVYVTPNS